MADIYELLRGRTLVAVEGAEEGSELVKFRTDEGAEFQMSHKQDCCENVWLADVIGDPQDLIGAYLARAEGVENDEEPPMDGYTESHTWTFYKFATIKGEVVFRWYGTSNGYYSESVDLEMVRASDADRMRHALGGPQLPPHLAPGHEEEY